eukprot:m51a1_g7480 hypothetical protein (194) ;mRNA; f:209998-210781
MEIVSFNVGGTVFSTTATTLRSRGENYLTRILGHIADGQLAVATDSTGRIFVDRSPVLFSIVLEYLRSGSLNIPDSVPRRAVLDELRFYSVSGPWCIGTPEELPGVSDLVAGSVDVQPLEIVEYWRSQARTFVEARLPELKRAACLSLVSIDTDASHGAPDFCVFWQIVREGPTRHDQFGSSPSSSEVPSILA